MILALRDDTSRHDVCRSLYWRSKARLPTGHASRPTRRGTCPIMVLRARVDAGCSRRAGPPGQLTARRDQTPSEGTGWTPPDGICVPRWWCRALEEASVGQANTVGLDIAKRVFQAHGADASGRVVFRKRLVRAKGLAFFAAQPPCTVAMEACAGAHHWVRELGKLGHTVRLIPPAYVKPYVKRQKNDMADAEAICEAAQRPSMRFVPVKSEEQQANGVVFRARDLLVRQRTQCLNALRGHLSEYGYVFPKGITHADAVIAHVEDPDSSVPESARAVLKVLIGTVQALEAQIQALDAEITQRAKADPVACRLMTIPGIGPIAATAITALVPAPEGFRAGRDFAAWLGLTPLQKSTGGKQKLGAISKMGERTIRRLLILGASAVVRWAGQRGTPAGSWLARMLARKPKMLVTVALANKTARIVWALLVKGGVYRAPAPAA